MKGVQVQGEEGWRSVLLANLGGQVYALSGICTHEDFDLSAGIMVGETVVCPLHLSQFDLKPGAVQNPPATEPLRTYNVKIEGDTIFVEV